MDSFKKQYPFIIESAVEWGDMDAFQHVNNTKYFRYFERVRFAHFEKYGLIAGMQSSGTGPILASTRCRFRFPLSYPDTILIGTRLTDLQADRFLMEYGIYSRKDERVAAEGDGFIIYYNYRTDKKADIPQDLYRTLQAQTRAGSSSGRDPDSRE